MNRLVKIPLEIIISSFCFYSGLIWLYVRLMGKRRDMPLIFYHEVGDNDKSGLSDFSVSMRHFEKQMKWLSRHYKIVQVNKFVQHITGKIKLPGKVAAVTFDGGYIGNYQRAFPILKSYNIPATIYVTTDPVDGDIPWKRKLLYMLLLTEKKELTLNYQDKTHIFTIKNFRQKRLARINIENYMQNLTKKDQDNFLKKIALNLNVGLPGLAQKLFLSWNQVCEMNKDPLIEIGSHTLSHPRLTEISFDTANYEIVESKSRIELKLNGKITSFCYPDGCFSKEIKKLVQVAGYSDGLAVSTPGILNDLNEVGDDEYELRRICMPDCSYRPLLAMELSGLMPIVNKIGKFILKKLIWR